MKNPAKIILVLTFALGGALALLSSFDRAKLGSVALAEVRPTGTPAVTNTNTVANKPAVNPPAATPAAGGDKSIPKAFTLGKDSLSEYGEVRFDHDAHAFQKYSPDGKSVISCVECHHTDQPKSALKPPLATSERDVTLTMDVFKTSTQKVSECRACHFQDGNVPDGKTMPTAGGKDMNNENAFHINCNACHDNAFKARPELKSKKGFATSKDCLICHTKN